MTSSTMATLRGAAAYEFRMQVRRPALWIGLVTLGLLQALGAWSLFQPSPADGIAPSLADWALGMTYFIPYGVAALLADRLPRDGRLGVDQVLDALPASPIARLYGKWAGTTAATLLPVLLVYLLGAGYLTVRLGSASVLAFAPVVFAAVALPGLLVVAALSVPLPALLWVPAYQVGFAVLWIWWTQMRPELLASPSDTFWNPNGWAAATRLFGADTALGRMASPGETAANLVVIAVLIVVPPLVVPRLLAARAARADGA